MTTRSTQKTIILLKQSNAIYSVSPFINLSTVKISAAINLISGNMADAIASFRLELSPVPTLQNLCLTDYA
jgi:hypothetical protein